jgi:glycosyltransferase involved in cell wall biosynthesis
LATFGRRTRWPRVAFVYPNSRRRLALEVAEGRGPDSILLGQNHLAELGIDAYVHEPKLTPVGGALTRRVLWSLRELALPWELRTADAVFTPLADLFPLAAAARGRPPVVAVNYGLCTTWRRSTRLRRRSLGASLRACAAVVCLGTSQRDLLLRQTGLEPERAHTVHLGIDANYFEPQPFPPDLHDPLVLSVGKDLARDYATLATALDDLGVRGEIACLGRNLEGVRLPPRVHSRFVEPSKLRELYREAACVVLPQRAESYHYGTEGGGLTALLEALACARPVVVTERPILRDYVTDGETALVVPPEQPDALSAAIAQILDDRELASRLGTAARRSVEQSFTSRQFAERIAPILLGAAGLESS